MKKSEKQSGMKKGKSSWRPASLNEFTNKEDGYRYRMMRKDPDNLSKKKQEGWEIVSQISAPDNLHVDAGRIDDGKPLTSVQEGRDWIYGRISEEKAQERDEYFQKQSDRQIEGLTAHLKKDMRDKGGNAAVHGNITISSRKGDQVIN
jgi:hypothetical protein